MTPSAALASAELDIRTEWWTDHTNLAALYRWLVDNDALDQMSTEAVHYFLSKPWKWTVEFNRMKGVRPANDSP